jgi:hypothetical protein
MEQRSSQKTSSETRLIGFQQASSSLASISACAFCVDALQSHQRALKQGGCCLCIVTSGFKRVIWVDQTKVDQTKCESDLDYDGNERKAIVQ